MLKWINSKIRRFRRWKFAEKELTLDDVADFDVLFDANKASDVRYLMDLVKRFGRRKTVQHSNNLYEEANKLKQMGDQKQYNEKIIEFNSVLVHEMNWIIKVMDQVRNGVRATQKSAGAAQKSARMAVRGLWFAGISMLLSPIIAWILENLPIFQK